MSQMKHTRKSSFLPMGFARLSPVLDPSGNVCDFLFTQVSPSFVRFLPLRRTAIIGRTISEIFHSLAEPGDNRLSLLLQAAIRYANVEFDLYFTRKQRWVNVIAYFDEQQMMRLILLDRTAQKNTNLLLNDEVQKMRQLFNSNSDAIIIIRQSDWRIVDVNDRFLALSSCTRDELIGSSTAELFLFPDENGHEALAAEIERNGAIDNVEVNLRSKGGDSIASVISAATVRYGEEPHVYFTIRDVSARSYMDEALVVSEANYRRLFEAAKDGILILDAESGKVMSVNPFLVELLGYSKEQILEKSIWELGLFKDILANREKFMELQSKEYVRYENLPLLTADGRTAQVEFVSNVYLVGKRKVIQCNIRDITERKRLEMALEKEKRIYEITLISVGDGVISCDNQNHIVFLNKAAELLTGWDAESARNQQLETVFSIVDEFTRKAGTSIIRETSSNENCFERGLHIILISKFGIERPIEYTVSPIIDEAGVTVGSVVVFRDFSEQRSEEKKIEFLSYHDQLTGLYNRRFYEEELNRLDTKRNLPIAIVMGDVNGLKLINDSFGHIAGDELLKKVAALMQSTCRADDILARLGGDEFVIILPKTDVAGAEQLVQRIKDRLSLEKVGAIDLSVSFGYEIKQNETDSMQEVFKNAEDHLYRHKLSESMSMRHQTINLILNALFEKNPREMMHSKRVGEIAEQIAINMGLSPETIHNLKTAGMMHDIGKIGIDESILNKQERLTATEWDEIKRHPEIGYRILSSVSEFSEIASCVLEHHERWDGTGYPRGLRGEQISLEARIVGFADAYDAMTTSRTYRSALDEKRASKEILQCSGTQFDPDIVQLFTNEIWNSAIVRE